MKYNPWEAIDAVLTVCMRVLDEVRTLARTPGPAGPPGLGWDDLTVEQVDDRTWKIKMIRGAEIKEWPLFFSVQIYRGLYEQNRTYARGDCVTSGGSTFVAHCETSEKPGTSSSWQLAAKRGNDGKNGKDGERGPEGKPGRDLTQIKQW